MKVTLSLSNHEATQYRGSGNIIIFHLNPDIRYRSVVILMPWPSYPRKTPRLPREGLDVLEKKKKNILLLLPGFEPWLIRLLI
jgi:hypothetical protein